MRENGMFVAVVDDISATHTRPRTPPHPSPPCAMGSSKIRVAGRRVVREDDVTACGHNAKFGGRRINDESPSPPDRVRQGSVTQGPAPQDPTETTSLDVSWAAPKENLGNTTTYGTLGMVTGYRIEGSDDGSTWTTLVEDTRSTDTMYTESGLAQGITRHYRITPHTMLEGSYLELMPMELSTLSSDLGAGDNYRLALSETTPVYMPPPPPP